MTRRATFLDKVLRNPLPPVATAASLRIAVRDAEYVANARGGGPAPLSLVTQPIGEGLFALLVSDSPDAVATVPLDTLATLGLTREQAWTRAWQQTRKTLPALPAPATLAQGAVAYVEQAYLASLLADTKGWAAIADTAGPELFVTVVADDNVLVGRMPDGAPRAVQADGARRLCQPAALRFAQPLSLPRRALGGIPLGGIPDRRLTRD